MRTDTHKLIYFWKKDQWEMYDLVKDPDELHNLYRIRPRPTPSPRLKTELYRLKKEVQDDDQFATQQPGTGVDPAPRKKKE